MLRLLFLLITGAVIPVQQGGFTLRGQILAATAKAAEQAEVTLENSQDRVVAKTLADGAGNFEFRNLESGRYTVVVRVEGYTEAREPAEVGINAGEALALAQLATITDDQQQTPAPIAEGAAGSSNVFVVLHKKDATLAENDPEFAAIAELSRKYPKKVLQEYEKAVEFSRKGDAPHAAERYEAVVKLAPDFYYVHNNLGILYQRMDRYRDAEHEYNLARKLNGQSDQPLLNLGKLFLQEADANADKGPILVGRILDQALDILEEATKRQPPSAIAHFLLGTAYYRSDFAEEAEVNLKRALEIDDGMAAARLTLANVYMRQEKWENALKLLDVYLERHPNAPDRADIETVRSKIQQNLKK
jgi:tetratricopeptide (TPR) repeat protein